MRLRHLMTTAGVSSASTSSTASVSDGVIWASPRMRLFAEAATTLASIKANRRL
jgi:hypothetical protein